MLTIIYGDEPRSIYNTNVYFKNTYESEWLESELAKKMIQDVDDSEVLGGECIKSPVLGQIPPERLSGGVKTLLLMLNEPDRIFNASTCGDNCAKWILEIAKQKDLTINLRHMMNFGKDTDFEIKIKNGGEVVHSMKELIPIASKYLNQMVQE
ncbi:hypothetical protein JCM17204_20730 [Blautia stercoris]|jgi:hypothetical protein